MNVSYIVRKNMTGVYALRHKPSGQVYVGGSGYCIYNRFRHHFVKLRQGKHATPKLQELWGRDGAEGFEQEILCFCCREEVRENEQKWIKHFRARDLLLNGSPEAARKRWSDPNYRAAVSEMSRLRARQRHAAGTLGTQTWTEESRAKWRRSMGYV